MAILNLLYAAAMNPTANQITFKSQFLGSPWRRFAAFLIDLIILWVIGSILGILLFETFCRAGAWGRLLGFCIFLPYFAISDSEVGGGQTLGKRLAGIQVVNSKGKTISFLESSLRTSVIAVPYFLNNIPIPISRTHWFVISLLGFGIFAIGIGTAYLIVFNRATRQGLPDLAVNSYVVSIHNDGIVNERKTWSAHWIILTCLLSCIVIGPIYVRSRLLHDGTWVELMQDITLTEKLATVETASAVEGTWHSSNTGETQKILTISTISNGKADEETALADEIAQKVIQCDPKIDHYDTLKVVVTTGYDLGIANRHDIEYFSKSPEDWKSYLEDSETSPDRTSSEH